MSQVYNDLEKSYKLYENDHYHNRLYLSYNLPSYIKCKWCSRLSGLKEVKDGYVIVCWDDSKCQKQCGKCVNEHTSMSSLMECGRFRCKGYENY